MGISPLLLECLHIHRSFIAHLVLYCSFTAKNAICCSCCILVPGDVNMYQIVPTSTPIHPAHYRHPMFQQVFLCGAINLETVFVASLCICSLFSVSHFLRGNHRHFSSQSIWTHLQQTMLWFCSDGTVWTELQNN